jgi:sulfane dehydrogenase subunit SoxC
MLGAGLCVIRGRAWSGQERVTRVELSTDCGATWSAARLEDPVGEHAWRGWSFVWEAEPGEREVWCRARTADGGEQPLDTEWNTGGYANNAVQRVAVTVR